MALLLLVPSHTLPTTASNRITPTFGKRLVAQRPIPLSSCCYYETIWSSGRRRDGIRVRACFFNPFEEQPILKDALKEPVAFLGGMFAGLLRLDLKEEPLREWVARTVEASGIDTAGGTDAEGPVMGGDDYAPQQIEIE